MQIEWQIVVDPDQTAVCTDCSDLSEPIFRISVMFVLDLPYLPSVLEMNFVSVLEMN